MRGGPSQKRAKKESRKDLRKLSRLHKQAILASMTSLNDIRSLFLNYFDRHHHLIVPSAPLVPEHDPTLLFTNAGMVPFKDIFTARRQPSSPRAASAQKCLRAGGKHNDLENVGYTARHHTFFEMLGNFSFGDYFKEQAIDYAWNFIIRTLEIPPEKLLITIFAEDDEAFDLWRKISGLNEQRILRIAGADNFWSMGATGPCGPCSEIFYDHGDKIAGGPPGSADQDGDRFVEIWNLVFMQFERQPDGSQRPLPSPAIDTGMGLERVAAVMQGTHDNYQIDLFKNLIAQIEGVMGISSQKAPESFRVIADHLRAVCFLIADNVQPSNEGRGYVLRRILRRAMRHIHLLGAQELILHQLVPALEEQMGAAYPELARASALITQTLHDEEERFQDMLHRGMNLLEKECAKISGDQKFSGEAAFRLYDTYGFPLDLTQDALRRLNKEVDVEGFDKALAAQQAQGRQAWKGSGDEATNDVWLTLADRHGASQFLGYDEEDNQGQILAIIKDGVPVEQVAEGDEVILLLDQTAFYAESGGQVGDRGVIEAENCLFDVRTTQKQAGVLHAHLGLVKKGRFAKGDHVRAKIDGRRRTQVRANHSATHLLHEALRRVLGAHVTQKGSLVNEDYLRFDFSHPKPLTAEEIAQIEALVNAQIRNNGAAITRVMKREQAIEAGALALFGEKYDDEVRVLFMGAPSDQSGARTAYSVEFCGGTHVRRMGDIALFKLVSQSAVGAGIRRVVALTGALAFEHLTRHDQLLAQTATRLKTAPEQLEQKLTALMEENKQLAQELRAAKRQLALAPSSGSAEAQQSEQKDVETLGRLKFIQRIVKDMTPKDVRAMVDEAKARLGSGIVAMVALNKGRASMTIGITKDLLPAHDAVALVKIGAQKLGGAGGGGRADFAQAGGPNGDGAQDAINAIRDHLQKIAP